MKHARIGLLLLCLAPALAFADSWEGKPVLEGTKLFIGEREIATSGELARRLERDAFLLRDVTFKVEGSPASTGVIDKIQLHRGKYRKAWTLDSLEPSWKVRKGVILPEHDYKRLRSDPRAVLFFQNEIDVTAVRGPLKEVLRINVNRELKVGGWFDRDQTYSIPTEVELSGGAWLRRVGPGAYIRRSGDDYSEGMLPAQLGTSFGTPATVRGTVVLDAETKQLVLRTKQGYVRLEMEAWDEERAGTNTRRPLLVPALELFLGKQVVFGGVLKNHVPMWRDEPAPAAPTLLVSRVISPQRASLEGTVEVEGLRIGLRVGDHSFTLFDHDPAHNQVEGRSYESRQLTALLANYAGKRVAVAGYALSAEDKTPVAMLPTLVYASWPVSQRSVRIYSYDSTTGRVSDHQSSPGPLARDLAIGFQRPLTYGEIAWQIAKLERLLTRFRGEGSVAR